MLKISQRWGPSRMEEILPGPTLHRGRGGLAALHVEHRALPYMLRIGGQNKFHPPTAQDTTWYSWHAEIQSLCNGGGHFCASLVVGTSRRASERVGPRRSWRGRGVFCERLRSRSGARDVCLSAYRCRMRAIKRIPQFSCMHETIQDTPGLAGNLAEDTSAMELGPVDRGTAPWAVPWTVVF